MDSPVRKLESPVKKPHELVGSVSKKKKERENRNSVTTTSDLIHEWYEKDEFIIVTVLVGSGHDNRTVNVTLDDNQLTVALTDGRQFQTKLFECVVSEATNISFKNHHCIIKLLKHDPNIKWPSLEICRNALHEKSLASLLKGTNMTPKIKEIIPSEMEESCNKNIVKISNPKINFVETRNELTVFLYVPSINKENMMVNFTTHTFTALFSTSDSNFLKLYPDKNEHTVFEWTLKTKAEIVPEQCSFKVSSTTLEIKLKKVVMEFWRGTSLPESIAG